jgi:ankyrin repeat protein
MSNLDQEIINQFVGAAHGDFATVKKLLAQQPAILNASAVWGETAIQAASQVGRVDITDFLISQGAPVDICTAAMLGRKEAVASMIAADSSAIHAQGAHGLPLMYFPVIGGYSEVAEMLLVAGATVNGGEGVSTPLHGAVMTNNLEMAVWLLAQGADPSATNYEGKTALEAAEIGNKTELAALLSENSAASKSRKD